MVKLYNIIKAEKSPGLDDYGNATFWLKIEGIESANGIRCLRKESSPWLSGPTWGELTDVISKAGKPYKKFKVMSAPEEKQTNEPRQYKADPDKQASIEWQSAIKAAVEAVRDYKTFAADPNVTTLESYKKDIVNTAITFARVVDVQPSELIESDEPADEDEPPIESRDEQPTIDLEEIPF